MNTREIPPSSALGPGDRAELEQFFAAIGVRLSVPMPSPATLKPNPEPKMLNLENFLREAGELIDAAEARQRVIDRREAGSFNTFRLIEPDENKLSDILADLLNPRGRHGQECLFLSLLFEQLGLASADLKLLPVKVQREAPTYGIQKYRRRVDILIDAGALVAIENKVDSMEQQDQVRDYLEHLHQCSRGRAVLGTLIYLTPNGRVPSSLSAVELREQQARGALACWSYQKELRRWLESCRAICEADKIRHFLSDFITYIATDLKRQAESGVAEESHEH